MVKALLPRRNLPGADPARQDESSEKCG